MATFAEEKFHDSYLLSIDFTHWLEGISIVFYCPYAGEQWEDGRYLKISFWRVLFFGFEPVYPKIGAFTLFAVTLRWLI